jgi:hypothetical protein
VWVEVPDAAGSSILEEFGGETRLIARAWLVPPAGSSFALSTVVEAGRRWRMSAAIDGSLTAFCDVGSAVIELTVSDTSGLEPGELEELHASARAALDVDAIAARAVPPRQIPAAAELLFPWPLPPGHPLVPTSAMLRMGALALGVAAVVPPWARILGPGDAEWASPGAPVLWHAATLNLIRLAIRGEIPMTQVEEAGARALRIGPHPLAVSCLALPDLALLAADIVGRPDGLRAHPLRPDLLVVAGPEVHEAADAWCTSVPVAAGHETLVGPG